MKTSKITHLAAASPPTWQHPTKGTLYNRYLVSFANGDQYTILAVGNFKGAVGDDFSYTVTNQDKKLAKRVVPPTDFTTNIKPKIYNSGKDDTTQKYIIAQSSMATAANFYQQRNVDENDLLSLGEMIFNKVIEIANK